MVFSYVLISVICFIELGIGFFILDIRDAWFIALIIAIFDVFPIVGSGGILVPWGVIALIMGDPVRGIGLMVLWGVIVVVRQVVEPKIVGSQIGLHPLVTIVSMYIGLELMGGLGLIMAPIYIIVCKKLNEENIIHLYVDSKDETRTIEENSEDTNIQN
jgi:predicted PurR-regulated permease PerM